MLREVVKGLLCLVVLAGTTLTLLSWGGFRPNGTTWRYRIAAPAAAVIGLGGFLLVHFRRPKDRVPDFLHSAAGSYFDRGGFCFAVATVHDAGWCVLHVMFQNRYQRPCHARVGLRPARGFFMTRAKMEPVSCDIDCGPGAYGVAKLRVGVPVALQGTRQKFDIGASVTYPTGRGRKLRKREGLRVGHNATFSDPFGSVLRLIGAIGGAFIFAHPANATLDLPSNVAQETPVNVALQVETRWVLTDFDRGFEVIPTATANRGGEPIQH